MDWKRELEFQRAQILGMLYLSKDDLFILATSFGFSAAICATAFCINFILS